MGNPPGTPPPVPLCTPQDASPNTPLRDLLVELGWSVPALARRVNAVATRQEHRDRIDLRTPRRWINGSRPAPPWDTYTALVLAEALGHPVTADDLGWPGTAPLAVPATHGLDGPWTTPAIIHGLVNLMERNGLDRRTLLTVSGAALTAPALSWLTAPTAATAGGNTSATDPLPGLRHGTGHLTEAVADSIDRVAGELRAMDDQLGGKPLVDFAESTLTQVTALLREHPATDQVTRRLLSAVAELSRIAARAHRDAGHEAAAQRHYVTGLRAAHAAGDRALGASILGWMSAQAVDLGHRQEAVTLADSARTGHPHAGGRTAALLHLHTAYAQAYVGVTTAAQSELERATSALDDAKTHEGPAWAYWVDHSAVDHTAGSVFTQLGRWPQARRRLGAALARIEPVRPSDTVLTQIRLASAHTGGPDRDLARAADLGTTAAHTLHSGRIGSRVYVRELRDLRTRLAPFRRNPDVRSFLDAADPLLRTG